MGGLIGVANANKDGLLSSTNAIISGIKEKTKIGYIPNNGGQMLLLIYSGNKYGSGFMIVFEIIKYFNGDIVCNRKDLYATKPATDVKLGYRLEGSNIVVYYDRSGVLPVIQCISLVDGKLLYEDATSSDLSDLILAEKLE